MTFILLDFAGVVGSGILHHESVMHHLASQILWDPMADSACLTTWFVYAARRPPRRKLLGVTGAGALLEVLVAVWRGPQSPLDTVLCFGPGLAVAAGLGFVRELASTERAARWEIVDSLALALCMPLFYLVGTFNFTQFPPRVYDLYAYAVDGGGLTPSFLVTQIVEHTPVVHALIRAVYVELPLLLMVARQYSRQGRSYTDPLIVFFVLGVVGCQIYKLCPMVGMRVLVGRTYPDLPAPVMVGPPHPVPAPGGFPRNCMPSLHLSWGLAAFWAVCRISPRSRWISLGFVLLTIVAARAIGDHYWVDFVAAFPFTVAVQGLCARASARNATARHVATIAGSALTALVIVGLLEFPTVLMHHPILTDAAALSIVVAAIWMEHRLAVATAPAVIGACR